MEKIIEIKTDYFLRYTAEIPADEINAHVAFDTGCPCNPDWFFNPDSGWHNIKHKTSEQETDR